MSETKPIDMRKLYFFLAVLCSSVASAQIVDIPDANFKNALINTNCAVIVDGEGWESPPVSVDTNGDGEIQVSEAEAVLSLEVSGQNIASLEGIESFVNLWDLDCSNNLLTNIIYTEGQGLIKLFCNDNQLTTLVVDFNGPDDFEKILDCSNNQLSTFTISDSAFYMLNFWGNQFTDSSLFNGLSGIWMSEIILGNNPFVTFDETLLFDYVSLTDCPLLTNCSIRGGAVTSVQNNPQLTAVNVGGGTYHINNNPILPFISIKNGWAPINDPWLPPTLFDFTNNPSLEFVCIDDLGTWYDEIEDPYFEPQYSDERSFVEVDPDVPITFYCDFTPGGNYSTLTGTITFDCGGSNEIVDSENVNINLDKNTNGSIDATAFPETSGQFTFYTSGNGTITPALNPEYFTVTPTNFAYTFPTGGTSEHVDFCISANGTHHDLEISLSEIEPARPGFDATYKIRYVNQGTETQSGTVSLSFPDNLTDFVSANPMVSTQADGQLSWDFSNLAPFESREIELTLNVNSPLETPAVNNGDVLDFTAAVVSGTDETPDDNTYHLAQTVVGSFDPNDKAVSKSTIGVSELNEYLYYTIRFENTGTFYAENIAIRDLLSDNLDLSTLEIMDTSHPCRSLVTRSSATTVDKLEFFFENIQLPATQDDPVNSHGFVIYRVKPKSDLAIGDSVLNEAEIYFDFNHPIVTNEVSTVVTALATEQFVRNNVSVFPNPARNAVTVKSDSALREISIHNLLGQAIQSANAAGNLEISLDISALQTGSYILSVESEEGRFSSKLIKQ